jgi:hypothetical protein
VNELPYYKAAMNKPFVTLLLFSLIFSLQSSCQENIKSGKQIPILAWYSIPPEQTTFARYMELKESGITHNLSFQ